MSKVSVSAMASLTIALQTVHTVYRDRVLTVGMVHLVNVTGVAATVQLHYVPLAGAAAAANAALYDYTIPANDFIEFGEGQLLASGCAVQATCSADNAVNLILCGFEE